MTRWSVDPDGVLGVLAGVDDLGPDFESAQSQISAAAMSASTLSVDGRSVLSRAWDTFMESRALVPGKIMYSLNAAASGVGSAMIAVVVGDEQMVTDTQAAEARAEDAWGIPPAGALYTSGVSRTP